MSLTKPGASSAQTYSLVIMMNRNKAEKIAAIVLLGVLVVIFCLQNFAHAQPEIQKHPYQFGYYNGKQAELIAFHQVMIVAIQPHQSIKGYTDAYNGARETT